MVLGDPADSDALRIAMRMLEIADETGTTLDTLFLYHKGAYAALNWRAELGRAPMLQALAARSGLRCLVCRTALTRMGMDKETLMAPYQRGGLADWLAACERSDRVLRFGDARS